MESKRRIVVTATDFSAQAREALAEAHAWALAWNAELHVLHVNDDLGQSPASVLPMLQQLLGGTDVFTEGRIAWEIARRRLEEEAKALGWAEDAAEFHVLAGRPAAVIERYVREVGADLFVAGRSGAGALERWILGGTSERLLGLLPCPIVLTGDGVSFPPAKVLVPVDFGPCTPKQLGLLAQLPLEENAEVRFLSVYGVPSWFWEAVESDEESGQLSDTLRKEYQRLISELVVRTETGYELKQDVREGSPAEEILEFLRDRNIDTVLIGDRGEGGLTQVLPGGTALKVCRGHRGRVLVVPAASTGSRE